MPSWTHHEKGRKGKQCFSLRFQWVKNMRSIATRLRRPCSVSTTEHLLLHWEGSRGPYLERIGLAGICTRQQSRQSRTRQGTTVLKSEIIQKATPAMHIIPRCCLVGTGSRIFESWTSGSKSENKSENVI